MKSVIRKFIDLNQGASQKISDAMPSYFRGNKDALADLRRLISDDIVERKPATVLEVGGIDRPLLSKGNGYKYVGIDIDQKSSCYEIYDDFIVQSIEQEIPEKVDVVVSTTLLEHIRNNTNSMDSMYNGMTPGSAMYHYIPSKHHPYSIILRLVGPRMQKIIIRNLRPEATEVAGYPAFFDACSPGQMRDLMIRRGFVDVKFLYYYKATNYFSAFFPAYLLVALFENLAEKMGMTALCSGFVVSARKP